MSSTNPAKEARVFPGLDSFRIERTTWVSFLETVLDSLKAKRKITTMTATTPMRTLPDNRLKNRQSSMQITPKAAEHKRCSEREGISKEHKRSRRWPSAVATKAKSTTASNTANETANAIAYARWAKG